MMRPSAGPVLVEEPNLYEGKARMGWCRDGMVSRTVYVNWRMVMQLLRKGRRAGHLLWRYGQLPSAHRSALRQAAAWIIILRTTLEVFSFRRVFRYVERRARHYLQMNERDASLSQEQASDAHSTPPSVLENTAAARTIWALHAVGRRLMPTRPCLTQALAGRLLLARKGIDASLHIGVTKSEGELQAHAWLEQDGTIIIGGAQSREVYHPFPALNR